eukprot:8100380-Pyramimonas_sp.AAC.1
MSGVSRRRRTRWTIRRRMRRTRSRMRRMLMRMRRVLMRRRRRMRSGMELSSPRAHNSLLRVLVEHSLGLRPRSLRNEIGLSGSVPLPLCQRLSTLVRARAIAVDSAALDVALLEQMGIVDLRERSACRGGRCQPCLTPAPLATDEEYEEDDDAADDADDDDDDDDDD